MLAAEFDGVISGAREGADWAWSRLYGELAGPVLGYLRRQGSRQAEDLLGEVWLQIARNIGTFEGDEAGFRSWVFTVAHHRVIDERRRRTRKPEELVADVDEPGSWDLTAETAIDRVATDRVQEMIERLVPAQRDVLLLRIVGGLTIPEIAEALGKRVGAVKALQRRGLEALKRLVDSEGVPR